jgi:hypothetical protein
MGQLQHAQVAAYKDDVGGFGCRSAAGGRGCQGVCHTHTNTQLAPMQLSYAIKRVLAVGAADVLLVGVRGDRAPRALQQAFQRV